jgi:methylthioribose-1-phosphate isomerase
MLSSDAVPILKGNREVSFCEKLFLSTTNPKRAMASVLSIWQRVEATRGAPPIGVASAYGVALAMRTDTSNAALDWANDTLIATRPAAIKLKLAQDDAQGALSAAAFGARRSRLRSRRRNRRARNRNQQGHRSARSCPDRFDQGREESPWTSAPVIESPPAPWAI